MTTAPQRYPEQETDDNQQIDVSDILQLVRTANEKGYIKSSNEFTKPKGEFKALTLKDIAQSNMVAMKEKSDAKAEISTSLDTQQTTDDQPDQSTAQDSEEQLQQADANSLEKPSDSSGDEPHINSDEGDMTAADQMHDNGADSPDTAEASQAIEDEADPLSDKDINPNSEPAATIGTEQALETDGFKTPITPADNELSPQVANAEYDRGFEEGKATALAEIDTNLKLAIASFSAAAEAITREESIDITQLETAMFSAINQLASERAGIEIDTNPKPFSSKVAGMVSRIRNRIDEPVIHLHPDDVTAIQPELERQLASRKFILKTDESMKRGDARVDVGSIGVMDLIDNQPSKAPAKSKKPKATSSTKTTNEDISEASTKDTDHE